MNVHLVGRPVVGHDAAMLGRLRRGEDTALATVERQLELLRRAHAVTDAVVAFEDERALADAAALDRAFARRGPVGPLHGLPVTVKDWIDVEGFPCAGESGDRERRPGVDATVVARLRTAGAVVVAKTRVWGRVAHPRDPARTVGGSSSGEAALVAAGASVLGVGSDSGGSIRLPAAWAGVCGLRPTAGRVPTTGHFPRVGPRSDGRTQIGPLAASVDGLELALSVMAGPDGRDAGVAPVPLPPSRGVSLRGLRVAAAFGEGEWQPSSRVAAAVERATGVLVAAGAQRVPWEFGWLAPAWDITHRYWARAGGRAGLTGADVMRELADWDRFTCRYLEATADIDVVVAPATAGPAPPHGDVGADAFAFLMPASLVGTPAVALPAGDEDGLPISVQLVGRPWAEPVLLAAGRAIERAGPG